MKTTESIQIYRSVTRLYESFTSWHTLKRSEKEKNRQRECGVLKLRGSKKNKQQKQQFYYHNGTPFENHHHHHHWHHNVFVALKYKQISIDIFENEKQNFSFFLFFSLSCSQKKLNHVSELISLQYDMPRCFEILFRWKISFFPFLYLLLGNEISRGRLNKYVVTWFFCYCLCLYRLLLIVFYYSHSWLSLVFIQLLWEKNIFFLSSFI